MFLSWPAETENATRFTHADTNPTLASIFDTSTPLQLAENSNFIIQLPTLL